MIYIIAAILIFGVLIAVHELGHFLAAKACGVRVNEFSIGMGPALLKKTKGDTQYSLRLLPIGGFCAMEGEEEDSSDPAALNNQGFWQKLLIFAAGALMNFLAGLIIILVLYAGVKAVNVPVIRGFAEGCPLESAAGLQEGDRILSIDGERIYTFSDVSLLLGRNKTGDFDLVIRRDGQKLRLENFHMERGEYLDQSGEKFTGFGLYFGAEELTFGGRLKYCWNQAVDFVRLVRLSLQMLITGEAGFSDMSGPVGIVSTITTVGEQSESAAAAAANVSILGPVRKADQVEVSATDARTLGIDAPVRESGHVEGSGACKLIGPKGEVELSQGVIIAKRHLHVRQEDAEKMGVKDKEIIKVACGGEGRKLIFDDVVVRVNVGGATTMHIDTDEAQAAGNPTVGEIYR